MPQLPLFSAVILDMDGLALDTEKTYCQAWKQAAQQMGHHLSQAFCDSLSGLSYAEVESKLLDYCGVGLDLQQFRQTSTVLWRRTVQKQGIATMPGLLELLDALTEDNLPFCLATNSQRINALECLQLAGLEGVFNILVTRDQVEYGKPAPDIFFTAAEQLGVSINRCLVVEDSDAGVAAAQQAGAWVILIPVNGRELSGASLAADLILKNLAELAEMIRCKSGN